jgi:hypothetical protein
MVVAESGDSINCKCSEMFWFGDTPPGEDDEAGDEPVDEEDTSEE